MIAFARGSDLESCGSVDHSAGAMFPETLMKIPQEGQSLADSSPAVRGVEGKEMGVFEP